MDHIAVLVIVVDGDIVVGVGDPAASAGGSLLPGQDGGRHSVDLSGTQCYGSGPFIGVEAAVGVAAVHRLENQVIVHGVGRIGHAVDGPGDGAGVGVIGGLTCGNSDAVLHQIKVVADNIRQGVDVVGRADGVVDGVAELLGIAGQEEQALGADRLHGLHTAIHLAVGNRLHDAEYIDPLGLDAIAHRRDLLQQFGCGCRAVRADIGPAIGDKDDSCFPALVAAPLDQFLRLLQRFGVVGTAIGIIIQDKVRNSAVILGEIEESIQMGGKRHHSHPVVIARGVQQLVRHIQQLGLHTGKLGVAVRLQVAHCGHGAGVVHHKDEVHALRLVVVELELHFCLGLVLIGPAGGLGNLGIAAAGPVVLTQTAALPAGGDGKAIQAGGLIQSELPGQNVLHPGNQIREFHKDIAIAQLGRRRDGQVGNLITILEGEIAHIGAAVGDHDFSAEFRAGLKRGGADGTKACPLGEGEGRQIVAVAERTGADFSHIANLKSLNAPIAGKESIVTFRLHSIFFAKHFDGLCLTLYNTLRDHQETGGVAMIRKGTAADLDRAEAIYHEILDHQAATVNYTNWIKGVYPTRADARRALEAGTFFVMEEDGQVVGVANLNHIQPPEYAKLSWSIPAEGDEVLVIHTLCIPPSCSGHGYAKAFVAFAIEHGRSLGCKAIRLDTYEGNLPAISLYSGLGFHDVGITLFHFENAIWENLRCFEYPL